MDNGLYDYLEERWGKPSLSSIIGRSKKVAPRKGSLASVWGKNNNPSSIGAKRAPGRSIDPTHQVRRGRALGGNLAKQTRDWKPTDVSASLSKRASDKAAVQGRASKLASMRKTDPVAAGVSKFPTRTPTPTFRQKLSNQVGQAKLTLHANPGLKKGLKVAGATGAVVGAGLLAKKLLDKRKSNLDKQKQRLAASHDVAYDLQEEAQNLIDLRWSRLRNLNA